MDTPEQPDLSAYLAGLSAAPYVREPRAEYRQMAAQMHELYTALITEGFHEHQALTILLHAATGGGS
jgi:hypothetical protein